MTPDEIAQLMRTTDWDAMFVADSPFKYKTFRRKQDKRAYPSQLEFGLKRRIPAARRPQSRTAGFRCCSISIAAAVLGSEKLRRPSHAVPLRRHRPPQGRCDRAEQGLARAGDARHDGDSRRVHAGQLRRVAAGGRRHASTTFPRMSRETWAPGTSDRGQRRGRCRQRRRKPSRCSRSWVARSIR